MTLDKLIAFLEEYNIGVARKIELTNGILFKLEQCPFCNGAHKDGAYIIHYSENNYVLAKCHHDSCSNANFPALYREKTGKNYKSKNKKKKKSKTEEKLACVDKWINEGKLEVALDKYENVVVKVCTLDNKSKRTMSLSDDDVSIFLQNLVYQEEEGFFDKEMYDNILLFIRILAHKNNKHVEVYNRIYNDGEKIVYELDPSNNTCVVIDKDGISVNDEQDIFFHHSQYYAPQVMPIFDDKEKYKQLPKLIAKYFNLGNKDDIRLFTITLVSCFLGTKINHPLLSISGQKGSGKSCAIKLFCSLVDPKHVELGSMPKNRDDLSLKISESLVTDFDNMSYLSKEISDVLCRAVTGGVDTRRTLYMDKQQTIFDLKSIIVLDGVQIIIKEDDLLDRTIFFTLSRFKSEDLKTEEEIMKEFEKDKPIILGYCFSILHRAMQDEEPVDRSKTLRMADFYIWAIKIGRAMGYKETTIIRLLEKNKQEVNYETLMSDVTAQAVLNYMEYRDKAVEMKVSDFYAVLKEVARELHLDLSSFPKQPNTLSRKLNSIKSNLEEEGIKYEIKNKGYAKEIKVVNAKPKKIPIKICD